MESFESTWRGRFERFARSYSQDHLVSGWSNAGLSIRLRVFRRLLATYELNSAAVVLDLGCGAGTYVRLLRSRECLAFGLDYSFPSLRRAVTSEPGSSRSYVQGEAYKLPFANETFDVVVAIGVFQALGDPEKALAEITRVLRPGGRVVLEFLNGLEVFAIIKAAGERLRLWPPRVRSYSPFAVRRWLAERGLHSSDRVGIYLPPRRLSRVLRFVERWPLEVWLDRMPLLPLVCAHAFVVSAKRPKR